MSSWEGGKKKQREVRDRCPGCSWKTAKDLLHKHRFSTDDIQSAVDDFHSSRNTATDEGDYTSVRSAGSFGTASAAMEATQEPSFPNRWSSLPLFPILEWEDHMRGLSTVSSTLVLKNVIRAIQSGASAEDIQTHLAYYCGIDEKKLRRTLNEEVAGFPAIFYIVETDDLKMIQYWIKYGGDPNATCGPERFPLLAFAILRGGSTRTLQRATDTVELLLALGALHRVIPPELYERRLAPRNGEEKPVEKLDESQSWCVPELQKVLSSALNLTQCYRLWQASQWGLPSRRQQQVVSRKEAERLLGLQYTVIGQYAAVNAIKRRLIARLAHPSPKPEVFIFAGPSGHGKTEIARSLGALLSTSMISIDCTTFRNETELFGPRAPYQGYDKGSSLNNFLSDNFGRPGIVFMDEFEKTGREIHNSLLIPFDQGEYVDHRNLNKGCCSKTIWILATNQFDNYILKFSETHQEELLELNKRPTAAKLLNELQSGLRTQCISHFGAPLAGRVSEIIPFLPFSPTEQQIIAHKGVINLEAGIRRPVELSVDGRDDNLVGNVRLTVDDEAGVCSAVAQRSYTPQLGARGILHAVTDSIYMPLVTQYLEVDEDLGGVQPETFFRVGLNADKKVQVWHMEQKMDES
ncbi:P-loop containing nucleoside triphosphate hydrolase protein [Xylaria palmicola]|nr:P-loop containing nucleoside triphosphate hydrolase protein [Xylaria palmicola]